MIDIGSEATSSARETSVFRGDPEKAAQAQARAWRIVFWIDTVVFLASLFFLFSWMFEFGYLPDWAVLSQLFFVSAIISFTQRRLLRFSSEKFTFVIAIADTGIIIEDSYTREVIEKSRLQAIIPAASRGLFTVNPLSLVIDDSVRMLPEHFDETQRLTDELTVRFDLPLIERHEAIKRGWLSSTLKTLLCVFILAALLTSLFAVISEFTAGLVRISLFLILFVAVMISLHRFISAFVYRSGAVIKRRNPALEMMIIPIIIAVIMTAFEAVEKADQKHLTALPRIAAAELPASKLAVLDPPARFESVLQETIDDDGLSARLLQAIASWPAEERSAYERILITATLDPAMTAPRPEAPGDGTIKVELSLRRVAESGRRHRFLRHFAATVESEEVILAIVRCFCLCAADLEASHADIYPGFTVKMPGIYRYSAASILRRYLASGIITRQGAIELLLFVRRIETALPAPATLLKTEDACWSEQLRQYGVALNSRRGDLSGMPFYPDPESAEVKQLRSVLFEMPISVLENHVAGNATFPAIIADLDRCKSSATSLIESWGYRIAGVLLLPYQLQNLVSMLDCSYDWAEIWTKNTKNRQHLHALGSVAALAAFQNEVGSAPASIAELCNWIALAGTSVQPPTDLFSGGQLNYEVASTPRLFSVGPDGQSGSADDIVLYP